MKTLLLALLLLSSTAFAQSYADYYGNDGSRYNSRPSVSAGNFDETDRMIERQQNYMRNQINQGMRELEVRSNIRRNDLINGGDGYPSGYNGRYRY